MPCFFFFGLLNLKHLTDIFLQTLQDIIHVETTGKPIQCVAGYSPFDLISQMERDHSTHREDFSGGFRGHSCLYL